MLLKKTSIVFFADSIFWHINAYYKILTQIKVVYKTWYIKKWVIILAHVKQVHGNQTVNVLKTIITNSLVKSCFEKKSGFLGLTSKSYS